MPGYDVMSEPVTPEYNVVTDLVMPEYKVTTDPVMAVYDVEADPVHCAEQTYPNASLLCSQCFLSFSSPFSMRRHMKRKHKEEYALLLQREPKPAHKKSMSNSVTPAPYPHDSLQCFKCLITFSNPKAKQRHIKKSHWEEYKLLLQKTDTVFTCYRCDETFSTSDELSEHSASHRAEAKPFSCSHCQATFQTFAEMKPHRRLECRKQHYVCQDCNMVFRSITERRNHRTTMHLQKKETKAHLWWKNRSLQIPTINTTV